MTAGDRLRVFATSVVTPREDRLSWADLVNANVGTTHRTEALGREDGFSGKMTQWQFGDLQFVASNVRGVSVRAIHGEDAEMRQQRRVWLSFCLSGGFELDCVSGSAVVNEKQFAVINCTRPYTVTFAPESDVMWVRVPRSYLEPLLPPDRTTILEGAQGAGHLALQSLRSILDQAESLDDLQSGQVVSSALGFVSAAMHTQGAPGFLKGSGQQATALLRIKQYIVDHLDDDDLSPLSVAEAMGMTPRYINKMFEHEGTSLMRWVWQQRLERARRALELDIAGTQPISTIAYACGFKNLSHFSRSFRSHFGHCPTACRTRDLAPPRQT